ncbi:MAG TPA: hypothetical protein VFV05_06660 [Methylomirabilota bacterium]|nr:hypothetical protein [Methylomirabilota bacterium]
MDSPPAISDELRARIGGRSVGARTLGLRYLELRRGCCRTGLTLQPHTVNGGL